MSKRLLKYTALLACLLFAVSALAQGEAKDLDDLLRQAREGLTADKQEFQKREADFRAARDQQKDLLETARRELRTELQRSDRLEKQFDDNEQTIIDMREEREKGLGALKELLGVLHQVTGDTQGLLSNSVTSAQIKGRGAALVQLNRKLDSDGALPTGEEIRTLWTFLLEEMTESGKVVKFPAKVTVGSDVLDTEVVRVGAFNLVHAGGYLEFDPNKGKLMELVRQPQGRFTKTAGELVNATGGHVVFGVDPTRGQILATYLDRPALSERIAQGGIIGYVIIGLGIVGLLLSLERLITLGLTSTKVKAQIKSDKPDPGNPLGRVLQVAEGLDTSDTETLELKLSEAVFKETPKLTRFLLFIKIISVVAPLLGLLGTVTGMIVTFQAITLYGTGDPKLMAGGISTALVTTVLGLTVAIPIVLLHTLVSGRSKHIMHVLQEQSAGIIADRSGKQGSES